MKASGAEPPQAAKTEPTANQSKTAPLCPVHNSPMKPSRKPGKFYCTKKADDGEYCRETAQGGSPMSTIYLLHFDKPLKHAKHYIGLANKLDARLEHHASG